MISQLFSFNLIDLSFYPKNQFSVHLSLGAHISITTKKYTINVMFEGNKRSVVNDKKIVF